MKKIFFLIVVAFIFEAQLSFSQIIQINVYQVQDSQFDSVYTEDYFDVINNPNNFVSSPHREVNGTYEIDLSNKQFKFYRQGILETQGDIEFSYSGSLRTIYFLIDGWYIGMIINLDNYNESCTWFSILGDNIKLVKFTRFEIVKGS
ncbi:MAG: hypothetical protein ACKO6J_03250 [Crocinitomicaceae bacterium]|jgi:hypothetical protein